MADLIKSPMTAPAAAAALPFDNPFGSHIGWRAERIALAASPEA